MKLPRLIAGQFHPAERPELRNRAERRRMHGAKRYFHNRALTGAMARKPPYTIVNSLLFRGAQSLARAQTLSGQWGVSCWVRRTTLGAVCPILGSYLKFNADNTLTAGVLTTTAVYRDPTAWMHIVVGYSYAAGRWGLYVNNQYKGAVTSSAGNNATVVNPAIGYDGTNYANMELAELVVFSAAGMSPTAAFVEADPLSGKWRPKVLSGITWGDTGCYLGKPWANAALGTDYSGLSNNWTANGFSATDVVPDSPTNVYATLNPLSGRGTLSNGNLTSIALPGGGYCKRPSTIPLPTSGKWYWEWTLVASYNGNLGYVGVGIARIQEPEWTANTPPGYYINDWAWEPSGTKRNNNVSTAYGGTGALGSTYAFAYDADAGKMFFRTPSGWAASSDPVAGTNPMFSSISGQVWPYVQAGANPPSQVDINFGQKPFSYTIPTGFKPLCTVNMPATSGAANGTFTGNASADGPCIYTGAVPDGLTINGNVATWGTHADKLATGFKIRTTSTAYNSTGTNTWVATYASPQKTTVGTNKCPANAQENP